MTPALPINPVQLTYPAARICGRLITRWEEHSLGMAVLDAATAYEMGREQIGWFVGNHPGITRVTEQLGRLDTIPAGGVWVLVPHSRQLASELLANWPHPGNVSVQPGLGNSMWRSRKVWVTSPENLKQLIPLAQTLAPGLAGVIILDPECTIYRARGGTDEWGRTFYNDRPQHIVNFRAALAKDAWQSPLLLLTTKAAKAVNTDVVARAFCLNAFRFIAGDSFTCSEEPIMQDLIQDPLRDAPTTS